ncbi:YceI family protein [Sunxiuqinia indica]|uniref:YceI family protein n=1 Tax=Sunxiuqinia indica TaxID=2692584 RepID=UPI001358921D|nr:YceI family protein [Sunxiuqinia indica]
MYALKYGIATLLLTMSCVVSQAQVITSRDVMISFFSEAPLEDIYAKSEQGLSAINPKTKEVYFKIAIQSFDFKKGLMQEHFNENYLESDQFPHAEFNGEIVDSIDFSKEGTYSVNVSGDLNIHGVTKNYSVSGEIKINKGTVTTHSTFRVSLADHNIKIPRLVIKNIAEVVEVTVSAKYKIK